MTGEAKVHPRRGSGRAAALLVALVAAAIVVAYRVLAAIWPSVGDQALFLYFGQRMNEGATLYVDIWDLKPPIIYLVNALAARFPAPLAALAVIESIALIGGGLALAALLRSAGAWRAAIGAALIGYALLVSHGAIAEGGNYTECYVIPFACLSMLLFARGLERGTSIWFAAAGASACIAAAAKLPGLAPLLAQLAFLALTALAPGRARLASQAGAAALAGFLLCLGLILSAGALLTDLGRMIDGSVIHPIHYAEQPLPGSGHDLSEQTYVAVALLVPLLLSVLAAFAGATDLLRVRIGPPAPGLIIPGLAARQYAGLFALWALADLAGALGTGRNYGHYFLPLAASTSAAAAMLITLARNSGPQWVGRALFLMWLASIGMTAVNAVRLARWTATARPPGIEGAMPASQRALLDGLRRHARPGDRLASWDNLHVLYLAGGLRNALPHLALLNGADSRHSLRTEAPEILAGLRRCPPRFVVMSPAPPGNSGASAFHGQVAALVARTYRPVPIDGETGPHRLFMRVEPARPGCPA